MMIRFYIILSQFIILMLFSSSLPGQPAEKKIIKQAFALVAYTNNLEISPKWSVISDVQERNFIKPLKQSQFSLRSQINYRSGQNWIVSAGMGYYLTSPSNPASASLLTVPEFRLNQDITYRQNFSTFNIGHRFRIEERFITKSLNDSLIRGYKFIERLSYMISFEYNLFTSKNKFHSLTFKASDGIFINASKFIVYDRFNQNRFYAGLNYHILKNIYIDLGYINLFHQPSVRNQYYNRNIANLSINHKMKIKK